MLRNDSLGLQKLSKIFGFLLREEDEVTKLVILYLVIIPIVMSPPNNQYESADVLLPSLLYRLFKQLIENMVASVLFSNQLWS